MQKGPEEYLKIIILLLNEAEKQCDNVPFNCTIVLNSAYY